MTNKEFIKIAQEQVVEYFNSHVDKTDNKTMETNDVFVVWDCCILGHQKALLSTTVPDGMYYEITYNSNKHEMYFDVYKKWENKCINLFKF